MEFAKNSVDPKLKFDAAKELCQYIHPKRKSTDISFDTEDNQIRVVVEDWAAEEETRGPQNPAPAKAKTVR